MKKSWWQRTIISCAVMLMTTFAGLFVNKQVAHAEQTYTIGVVDTFAPFEIQNKQGTYTGKKPGIEPEMIRMIAKHEHFKYRYKIMSFNAILQALDSGQIDAGMGGMSVTDERKAKIDFSTSYYKDGIVMAVGKNSKDKYGFKIKYFTTSNAMWNDVKSGNGAATFDDGPVLQYGIRNGMPLKIVTKQINATPIAIGFKKGQNKELQAKINDGIKWMQKTGRMQKLIDKYTKGSGTKTESSKDRTIFGLIKNNRKALLTGLWETIELTIIGSLCALAFGLVLGVMGIAEGKFWKGLSSTIIYIFRGIPMMVLAFFIYIGLPNLTGQKIPLFTAGVLTLMLDEGAYVGAIVRGGFEAVDVGQWEAARSLGLPYSKALVKVIAPQGLKIMVPSLVNQLIITLKDTSILSAIGVMELTQTGTVIIARNMEGFKMWLIIAVMYMIIITLLTWLSNYVQKRMEA